MRTATPWRPRVSTALSLALDLGDGWELLAGRDCRPWLRAPGGRLREVGLGQEPDARWLELLATRLADERLPSGIREALLHAQVRWGG